MATHAVSLDRQRVAACAAALVITAWGAAGLYDGLRTGFSGGLYDPGYRVVGVRPGSLADMSGFKAGDRVVSVEGRAVETLGMESRWPRALVPRIGESRRFIVSREGQQVPVDVTFRAPFAAAVRNRIRAALIGLVFMAAGVWPLLTVSSRHATTLAGIGLASGASASLGIGPHLGSWNGVQGHAATAAGVLMLILMVRFFVEFPAPKAIGRKSVAAWLLYAPWVGLLGFLVAEVLVHPALYDSTGSVASLLTLAYTLAVVAAVVHTVAKGPRAEIVASGMPWILGGFLAALGGTLVLAVLAVDLSRWIEVALFGAIPFSMALAVRQHARR